MLSAAYYRRQADTCFRLADGATDMWVATALNELAEQFMHSAREVSADAVPADAVSADAMSSDAGLDESAAGGVRSHDEPARAQLRKKVA